MIKKIDPIGQFKSSLEFLDSMTVAQVCSSYLGVVGDKLKKVRSKPAITLMVDETLLRKGWTEEEIIEEGLKWYDGDCFLMYRGELDLFEVWRILE